MEKRTVDRLENIIFTNWTDKEFVGTWAKKAYPLKPGKSYEIPFYLAEHFAKHLADREYWNAFNSKLQELKKELAGTVDRQTLEHRVANSNEVQKLSVQEMLDKCVTLIPKDESEINVVRPKEVKMKEVVLRRDERAKELQEKYPGIDVQMNKKALKQEEEFEEEKVV